MATTKTQEISPLQQVVNTAAIRLAEEQYRLARYFTPFDFEPERADYDRVKVFIDDGDINRAFPAPTINLSASLERMGKTIAEQKAIIDAFAAQKVTPTLTDDQLFATGQANVRNPSMRNAA